MIERDYIWTYAKGEAPRGFWRVIVAQMADRYGVTFEAIMGKSRCQPVSTARHHAWSEIMEHTRLTGPQIAMLFNCHHTSIYISVRRFRARHP